MKTVRPRCHGLAKRATVAAINLASVTIGDRNKLAMVRRYFRDTSLCAVINLTEIGTWITVFMNDRKTFLKVIHDHPSLYATVRYISLIHTADATQLDSCVASASAVCIGQWAILWLRRFLSGANFSSWASWKILADGRTRNQNGDVLHVAESVVA